MFQFVIKPIYDKIPAIICIGKINLCIKNSYNYGYNGKNCIGLLHFFTETSHQYLTYKIAILCVAQI